MMMHELRKARRALQTARVDLDAGDGAASVNRRSYYARYYAARAMLMSAGTAVPKTHSALIGDDVPKVSVGLAGPFAPTEESQCAT
jgi:uncharacterized protein (UPF0332 family)